MIASILILYMYLLVYSILYINKLYYIIMYITTKNGGGRMRYYEKIELLLDNESISKNRFISDLNLSNNVFTKWRKRTTPPKMETLNKIAEYFNVSIESLMDDCEESIQSNKKMLVKHLLSFPQRITSIRSGSVINITKLVQIAKYVNCSIEFLGNINVTTYYPPGEYAKSNILQTELLDDIKDIMDRCADSDLLRVLQIQLSRIVIYHLNKMKITKEILLREEYKCLSSDKVNYIYTNVSNLDFTLNYGFNLTDLYCIRERTGLSIQFMFTGINQSISEYFDEETKNMYNTYQMIITEKDAYIEKLKSEILKNQ